MSDAATDQPHRDVRYEFNAPMWHAFPGPEEEGDGTRDSDSVSQGYFNDPTATAALLTPNARQNVVTVRRRSGPNGRSSGLISPQPIKAGKRVRMEVGDENAPPAAAAGGAHKKQKPSNIRTSWGGAVSRGAPAGSTKATGGKGSNPAPWPPPPKRDALRQIGSPRSRAAAAAASARAPGAAAPAPGSGSRTRGRRAAGAAAPTALPAATSACAPAVAADSAAAAGSTEAAASSAQQPGPPAPQPVPEQQAAPVRAGPQPEQRSDNPVQQQQHAGLGQLTPVAEHAEVSHFTRSAAKALGPEGRSPPAAAAAPDPVAAGPPSDDATAAAPMSGRKRSLRGNSGSPAAAPAVSAASIVSEAARALDPAAAAAAVQQAEDCSQAAKRRARPRKSGLHTGLAMRLPAPVVSSPAPNSLSASAIFVGATAALLSVKASLQEIEQDAVNTAADGAAVSEVAVVQQQSDAPAVLPALGTAAAAFTASQTVAEPAPAAAAALVTATLQAGHTAAPAAGRLHRRSSSRQKGLTIPQSPMLRSKLRYRPPVPDLTTEELRIQQAKAEAEEAAQLRAVNAAAAVRVLRAMPRLPPRQKPPLTIAHSPPLQTSRRPRTHDMATRSAQGVELTVAQQLAAFEAGRGLLGLTGLLAASAQGSTGAPRLTHPESPELRTSARLRGPRFMSTEEAEAAAMAALPPFTAHPVGRAVFEGDGRRGLPPVPKRPPTQAAPFHLSASNALPPPPQQVQPFVFAARPVPAATQHAEAAHRPPRAPPTQTKPFTLSTDARAPRRAAALAAQQALHAETTAGSRVSGRSGRRRRSSAASAAPKPPTQAASPRLSLTARAADRARFDGDVAQRAQQAEVRPGSIHPTGQPRVGGAPDGCSGAGDREAAELAAYRRTLEFKARPVPSGDAGGRGSGPAPQPPLTVPQSPYLNTRSRAAERGL